MTRFSERLKEHDSAGSLLGVWDDFSAAVQRQIWDGGSGALHGHERFTGDRATRRRWVNGEMRPRCEACVQTLATLLKDDLLLDAWIADGAEHDEQRSFSDAATRVSGLPTRLKRKLQEQLRVEVQQTEFSTRESLRIGVRIGPLTPTLHRGEVAVRWQGGLPARAKVRVASDREALIAAFADASCIYRDLLHLSEDELAAGYERLTAHASGRPIIELSVKRKGEGSWTKLTAPASGSPGSFEFANDFIDEAEMRLKVIFPCPAQYTCYPVQFGSYRVRGVATVSLRLAEAVSREMPKLLVLPPDCVTIVEDDDGAASIELGENGTLLPAATTAFFYWAPTWLAGQSGQPL
jgi:hypothetical protein